MQLNLDGQQLIQKILLGNFSLRKTCYGRILEIWYGYKLLRIFFSYLRKGNMYLLYKQEYIAVRSTFFREKKNTAEYILRLINH